MVKMGWLGTGRRGANMHTSSSGCPGVYGRGDYAYAYALEYVRPSGSVRIEASHGWTRPDGLLDAGGTRKDGGMAVKRAGHVHT